MNKIIFPLKQDMRGTAVDDLQNALLSLLNRGALSPRLDDASRTRIVDMLMNERGRQEFGEFTARLVFYFQEAHRLNPTGEVDEKTAAALNSLLDELGLLDTSRAKTQMLRAVVSGRIQDTGEKGWPGLPVRAVQQLAGKTGVVRLGTDTTDADGRYTIRYERPLQEGPLDLVVEVLGEDGQMLARSTLVRNAKHLELVNVVLSAQQLQVYQVEGRVASETSLDVAGLEVVIVDKGVGGDATTLVQTRTDDSGRYSATFSGHTLEQRRKRQPDLQAQVFSDGKLLGRSSIRYNASPRETLDVLLPAAAAVHQRSEHEVLLADLGRHYAGRLGDLKETPQQQDISFLARKTGWDARAVALAALADQFSSSDGDGENTIPQPFFYALFRAGLPANERTLFHTEAQVLETIWEKASSQGVIPAESTRRIPEMVKRFQALGTKKLLSEPPLIGTASFGKMLAGAGLDDAQQRRFAHLYTTGRQDLDAFWDQVAADPTFGSSAQQREQVVRRLQFRGRLARLTLNNEYLVEKLSGTAGENPRADLLVLAQEGYYKAQAWLDLLTSEVAIPEQIPGSNRAMVRQNYAAYLAAQVRLTFPTMAIAHMVKTRELPLGKPQEVADFLLQHQEQFQLGVEPAQRYISRNQLQVNPETLAEIQRLERILQITPNDHTMEGLLRRGIGSAAEVMRHEQTAFVAAFSTDLGGREVAAQIWNRSRQVHGAVVNLALAYIQGRYAPALGHDSRTIANPVPSNPGDVLAYSTLEQAFGNMDFCACEHCRSILSPAAYLVDLLQFLDNPDVSKNTSNPQTVLLERRPDIQHLPLTCENTNTALPYIDLVNETLEYYVANTSRRFSLQNYRGHDTRELASEDLLASPEFVLEEAYDHLKRACFPLSLPLHRPLALLRNYCAKFDQPLPQIMEALCPSDAMERGSQPYGWRDILMEELEISRNEHDILTDSSLVPLARGYGLPDDTAVIVNLSNGKRLAQRLGLSYEELSAILATQFINPHSALLPRLERLGVSFEAIKALKRGSLSDADFEGLLPKGAAAPDPAYYGGDIKAWLRDDANHERIMGLITLAIPAEPWAASKNYSVGDCVRPGSLPAGSTLYYRCIQSGRSRTAEPKWQSQSQVGDKVTDGGVQWLCRDIGSCESFEDLALRYADPGRRGQQLEPVHFLRLLRFVRLREKLGWTIAQTDAALTALCPPDSGAEAKSLADLDQGFKLLLPRLGVLRRVQDTLKLNPKRDLLALLACLAPIGTHDGLEWVSSDGGLQRRVAPSLYRQLFLNPALLAQDAIFSDDGYGSYLDDPDVRLVNHVGALQSACNLTDDEYSLIAKELDYDKDTVLSVETASAVFRHGWLARKLKTSVRELLLFIRMTGLDPFGPPEPVRPQILRLIQLIHAMKESGFKSEAALYLLWNQDLSGKSVPEASQIEQLARALRADFASVDSQFTAADGEDDVAAVQIALVYGPETSDRLLALLDGTLTMDVPYAHVKSTLEAAIVDTDSTISYDDPTLRLSYRGLMSESQRDALKAAYGSVEFKGAIDALYGRGQEIKGLFFNAHPELLEPYQSALSAGNSAERRAILLAELAPELISRRKHEQGLQRLSTAAGIAPAWARALLAASDASFPLHAIQDSTRPGFDDVLALGRGGLTARFFYRDSASDTADKEVPASGVLEYGTPGGHPRPNPGGKLSGIWSGFLEAPDSGYYNLVVEAPGATDVLLTLGGDSCPLVRSGARYRNESPVHFEAGSLHRIEIQVNDIDQRVRLRWDTPQRALETIPARFMYAGGIMQSFTDTYIRFLKAVALGQALQLLPAELAHLATSADGKAAGWLNTLTVHGTPAPESADTLRPVLEDLLEYSRLKSIIAPDDESLLRIVGDPVAATQGTDGLLLQRTRWEPASLQRMLDHFNLSATQLAAVSKLARIHKAMETTRALGVGAETLIAVATNAPDSSSVTTLQAALRARYDIASWRDLVHPINDELRSQQRDALVAYVLHQMSQSEQTAHIDTPDKLFEYFLMDVQMDPCMQTSRVRNALSSVQLFTERCLLSLEPRVAPSSINAQQWEWMKRYRVWEANRKIFLYPENWLEPELRDDQSPIFKEAMGELLQGDITEERAAQTFIGYLTKLEEIAKLEITGIHHVPRNDSLRKPAVSHVIGRTSGAGAKYFYRRREGGTWTPWEEIKLDIEDKPVIPVVWNNRLFVFWLRILQTPEFDPPKLSNGNATLANLNASELISEEKPKLKVEAILCWSEYANGQWQATRTSDIADPLPIETSELNEFDRTKLKLAVEEEGKQSLRIMVVDRKSNRTSFLLHNAFGIPEVKPEGNIQIEPRILLSINHQGLSVQYSPEPWSKLLSNILSSRTIQPTHPLTNMPWVMPFFYEDVRHVFYVTTKSTTQFEPAVDPGGIYIADTSKWGNDFDIPSVSDVHDAEIALDFERTGPVYQYDGFDLSDSGLTRPVFKGPPNTSKIILSRGTVSYKGVDIFIAGSIAQGPHLR